MLRAFVIAVLLSPAACAQTVPAKETPHDRVLAAAKAISIDDITQRPWHLKISVTMFDSKGANPQDGSIEIWRSGEDRRTTFVFGGAHLTLLQANGMRYGSEAGVLPDQAELVLDQFLHAGPTDAEVGTAEPELRRETISKTPFDCVMLTHPIKGLAYPQLGLFPTYCLLRDTHQLRLTYGYAGQTTLMNNVGKFLEHEVPTAVTMYDNGVVVGKAKVTALATFVPDAATFAPAADDLAMPANTPKIGSSVIAGMIVKKVAPVYPDAAKARHVSGTVTMRAIIGRDGHIHRLTPMSYPDADLMIAALQAVRQWIYKPYLLNGTPTEVDTTVIVNFNLSS